MPSFNGGDDFAWISGPVEGLRLLVVLFEEAIDGGLEIGDGSEHASLQSPLCEYCEKSLDGAFMQAHTTSSKTRRKSSLSQKRAWRFFEKVE
jgi:hypothetical protein